QDVLFPGSPNRDFARTLTTRWGLPVGSRNPCGVRERLASFLAAQPRSGAAPGNSSDKFGRMDLSSGARGWLHVRASLKLCPSLVRQWIVRWRQKRQVPANHRNRRETISATENHSPEFALFASKNLSPI